MHTCKTLSLSQLSITFLFVTPEHGFGACTANLVGQQARLDITLGGSATATVVAGSVEFNPASGDGRFSVDVESSSIRMFNNTGNTNVPFNSPNTYKITLSGQQVITGLSVAIHSVSNLTGANVSLLQTPAI